VGESALQWLNSGAVAFLIKGGIIMIPLLVCSVISVTVTAERLYFWRSLQSQNVDATILALVAEATLTPRCAWPATPGTRLPMSFKQDWSTGGYRPPRQWRPRPRLRFGILGDFCQF
jgi:hypothetical protein